MKYIVLTTKHHDGFCLWDTKLTDYNIMNSPVQARRGQGTGRGVQEAGHRLRHLLLRVRLASSRISRSPAPAARCNARSPTSTPTTDICSARSRELITNYGPLLTIWNDVPQMFEGRGVDTIKMVRELQPDILINNRTGDGGDYDTPEQTDRRLQPGAPVGILHDDLGAQPLGLGRRRTTA